MFLGILMGVAIRTRKPLDLHLAPMVWKQLINASLAPEDIEEVPLSQNRLLLAKCIALWCS